MITEEFITKNILRNLIESGWNVVCFDFPQSGTGICLHPNDSIDKTIGIWIPDVVAVRDGVCKIYENKSYLSASDINKIKKIKNSNNYSLALEKILLNHKVKVVKYGIGLPMKFENSILAEIDYLDFVCFVDDGGEIKEIQSNSTSS